MYLKDFDNQQFDRGRGLAVEALWRAAEGLFFNSWVPGSAWRIVLLRLFGASVGNGVVIKPHVRVKFPWKLSIGDNSWIGEQVWLDNLDRIEIGHDSCLSQGAYLGTGNHRWDKSGFDLEIKAIRIGNHCWLGAKSVVGPGVQVGDGAVLCMGSCAVAALEKWSIYKGTPAAQTGSRDHCGTASSASAGS